jgi:hypothetical protein
MDESFHVIDCRLFLGLMVEDAFIVRTGAERDQG